MNHVAKWRIAALCALPTALVLSACGGSDDKETPVQVDRRSTLTFNACAVPIADPSAICGTLTVAQDRADNGSRLIGLPFAILPAKTQPKAADPVVIFTGGPGPSSLRVIAESDADALTQYPLRQRRDVIVMTQRGADLTTPLSLDCEELALDFNAGERFADESAIVAAATRCRDRLTGAGIKFSAYTTKVIARDMEDLRVLLGARRGFSQWNVIGSSYGSLLAQVYVRDTPQGVRSVVYDGPLPLTDRSLYYAGQLDALTNVIDACNAQSDCAAAYPNLRDRFASAIERLQVSPAMVRGVPVRGFEVLNAVRVALAVPQAAYGNLPLFMDRVAAGDLVGADALLPFVFNLVLGTSEYGMYFTIECTNEGGVGAPASNGLPTGGAGWPYAVRRLIANNGNGPAARLCPLWTQGQTLSTTVANPIRSNIPSLITVGQFDGSTPTTSADSLQVGLSRAYKIVFTGLGHGLLESDVCMLQVTAAFLDDLTRSPDTSCIDSPSSLRFTTPSSLKVQASALQSGIENALRQRPFVQSVIAQVESPGGGLLWSGAAGVVDRDSGAKATAQTAFRIASVTKTFTSAAVHRLTEQRLLRLDDPIALHLLPTTAAALRQAGYETDRVTVLQLLAHTSGLPNYDSPEYQRAILSNPSKRWTRAEQLQFAFERFAKVAAPGQTFEYSDTGYILLGEIIENKTRTNLGAAYRSLLRFDELGLASTWMEAFEAAPAGLANFAHAYADNGLDLRAADASADTFGGGGLVSTVGDLTRFFRALLEGRVVSAASLDSMQTQSIVFGSGLGRGIFLLPVGEQSCWGHEGFWGVGVYYCPASRISVALTTNLAVFTANSQANGGSAESVLAASLIEGIGASASGR